MDSRAAVFVEIILIPFCTPVLSGPLWKITMECG
jgi:hypothetical protein